MAIADGPVVVGGGPAGLATAIELQEARDLPGDGDRARAPGRRDPSALRPHRLRRCAISARSSPGRGTPSATGSWRRRPASRSSRRRWSPTGRDHAVLRLTGPAGREEIEPPAVVLATGCRERPRSARLVPGSRPAGVMTTSTLQQLVHLRGEKVGSRAVIVGAEHVSFSAVATLAHGGASVAGLVTELPRHQSLAAFRVGAALRYRAPVLVAHGGQRHPRHGKGRVRRADRPRTPAAPGRSTATWSSSPPTGSPTTSWR